MSLLTRLFLLVLLAVLPALGVGAYHEFELREIRAQQVHDEALRLARLVNSEIGRIAEGSRQLLAAFAENPVVAHGDWPGCDEAAARLRSRLAEYFNIGVITTDGTLVCSGLTEGIGVDVHASPAFQNSIRADGFAIGTFEISKVGGTRILPFTQALYDADHKKIGFAFVTLKLDWLTRHFSDQFSGPDMTLTLVDRDATILLRLPDPDRWFSKQLDAKYLDMLNAAHADTIEVTGMDGVLRIIGYSPLGVDPVGIYVGVGLRKAALFAGIDRATATGVVLVILCLALALMAAWLGGIVFLRRPLAVLLQASEHWRQGDYSARTRLTDRRSEIGQLGRAFDEMAGELERRENDVRQANEMLEQRVVDRTAELVQANRRLAIEIEERQRVETALHHAQRLEAIGQLTSGVAHDFNNLLTAVLGNIELAAACASDGGVQKLLSSATRAAERGAHLVEQLLAFSRKQRLQLRPVDINGLVRDMGEMLNRSIGPTINIDQRLSKDLWLAMADPSQIELVVLNLAINARDAMPSGGRLLIETGNSAPGNSAPDNNQPGDPERPAELGDGDFVQVTVSDTGGGMTEAVLAKALEPFFTTKEPGKGSGLGLSMVYGVAKQSGGTLTLASRVGEGTLARVYLPRAQALSEVASSRAAPADVRFAVLTDKLVLLIDDDEDVRQVTAMIIEGLGCRVVTAENGTAGLALLETNPDVGLAVIDFAMPGMNGVETAEQVMMRRPELPVVIITGYADTAFPGRERPELRVLKKPFQRAELAAALVAALAGPPGNVVPLRAAYRT